MTDLESAVTAALRLSTAAANALLPTIQRNISTARAELIRSGVPEAQANGNDKLVEDCIISFCLLKMGEESSRAWHEDAFRTMQDNIRKTGNNE